MNILFSLAFGIGVLGVPWLTSAESIKRERHIEYQMGPYLVEHGKLADFPFVAQYKLVDDQLVEGKIIVAHVQKDTDEMCLRLYFVLDEMFGDPQTVNLDNAIWIREDQILTITCEKVGAVVSITPQPPLNSDKGKANHEKETTKKPELPSATR
jgi:hypothetical protein